MLYNVKLKLKKQTGFTLVEVLVVLAITSIIGTGIATSIMQITNINSSSNNRMVAIKQVENALHYINRDAQMAQTIQTGGSSFLAITYCDWDNTVHTITYTLNGSPTQLQRSETTGTGQPTVTTVANYVDSSNTSCSFDSSLNELTVILTSNVGGYKPASETRTLKVRLRSIQ
jgi:prepilin-type N-terminal cleavage/methylation domain-containing protein